ncbi:MAG: response regulator [Candidatus Omnitrophica bacterium]|nr:response regulator [Candidatus Omnitrophota bacterium]
MLRFKNSNTILVVDDEVGPREALRMILQDKYNILTCDDPQEAMDVISSNGVDLVMLDLKMPKVDGIKLLKAMKAVDPDVEIVLITAYPSTQSAIEAMEFGAYDYVIKPFDKDKIEQVARKGIIRRTQRKLEKNISSNLISEIYKKFSQKNEK